MFKTLDLAPTSIAQDVANQDSGVYLYAAKQWEYVKAWQIADSLSKELGRPLKVADLGGGRGALSAYLAASGHDVEVFDIDYRRGRDSVGDDDVERRFHSYATTIGLKVSYGSLFNIPAASGAYDLVLSVSDLGRVPYKSCAIKDALRLLRSGGGLFLSFDFTTDTDNPKDGSYVEAFTPHSLQATLDAIGVRHVTASPEQIKSSAALIQNHGVKGIAAGTTIASLVITKIP